jgi:ABC-type lipoprotein release transport system permease subunit
MLRLPIAYSLRNLKRRPWHSLATALGVGIVVFASVLMLSLTRGLSLRVAVTGEEQNVLVISRAGQNIMFSSITEDELVNLSSLPGVALDSDGDPLVSPEVVHMATMEGSDGDRTVRAPIFVRGVTPAAYEVHKCLTIREGELPFAPDDILVGCTAHVKLGLPAGALKPGGTLRFDDRNWRIAGIFQAGGSLVESEIWMDTTELQRLLRRRTHTVAVVRMADAAAARAAMPRFERTGALERYFKGWTERDYYQEFGSVLSWVLWLCAIMVAVITVAGTLIGANTMYTAVMNRMREMATYRVLGFSRLDILASFVVESTVLALVGALGGTAAGLLVNGIPLKLSYGAFFLVADGIVLGAGLLLGLVIGLIGGIIPAIRGLRIGIVEGLKHAS